MRRSGVEGAAEGAGVGSDEGCGKGRRPDMRVTREVHVSTGGMDRTDGQAQRMTMTLMLSLAPLSSAVCTSF